MIDGSEVYRAARPLHRNFDGEFWRRGAAAQHGGRCKDGNRGVSGLSENRKPEHWAIDDQDLAVPVMLPGLGSLVSNCVRGSTFHSTCIVARCDCPCGNLAADHEHSAGADERFQNRRAHRRSSAFRRCLWRIHGAHDQRDRAGCLLLDVANGRNRIRHRNVCGNEWNSPSGFSQPRSGSRHAVLYRQSWPAIPQSSRSNRIRRQFARR
jgi:hypothetical protein